MSIDFSSKLRRLGPLGEKTLEGISDQLQKFQDAVKEILIPLDRAQALDAQYIEGVALTTAGTQIAHKLLRPAKGFIIYDLRVAATVHRTTSEDESAFIKLVPSANATVSVLVF